MKNILVFSFWVYLLPFVSVGQTYPEVVVEKKKSEVDENNQTFLHGKQFLYQGEFSSALEASDTAFLLVVLDPKKRTNKRQTEILYVPQPMKNAIFTTGVVENEYNLWLHPPRFGVFRALETCPFPYLRFPLEEGKSWTDKMSISDQWSDPKWGVWEGRLMLEYTYGVRKPETIKTPLGRKKCTVVMATADSEIGTTTLKMYFHPDYGFLRLEYSLASDDVIILTLQEVKEGRVYKGGIEFLNGER
ncbi:MAG: hypothetical protein AAF740_10650 [Bacteroidota bacterium]